MSTPEPIFVYFEDDRPSRTIVQVLLTRVMKYEHVIMFEDSEDVIGKLEALGMIPTVFFIDIQIKPHDGYEILHTLRADARYQHARMIAMTANVMSHDVHSLRQAGFDGLLGKPILQEKFPEAIAHILSGQNVWIIP